MSITVIPDFPAAGDPNFSSLAYASFQATKQAVDDLNQVGAAYALSTNTTSTTSNTIGTGDKSFTVQTNLGYVIGMTIRAASTATPINNITGLVKSYNKTTGALVITVDTGGDSGSGTFTAWTISLAAVGANSAGDISVTPAGNIAASNVQDALEELDTEKAGLAADNVFIGTNSFQGISATGIDNTPIGATDPDTGAFTSLSTTGQASIGGNLLANSGYGSAAVMYGCRAWVNFDATRNSSGGTDSANTARFIRASGNVTSVVKLSTGIYTVTFTNAMPDVEYSANGFCLGLFSSPRIYVVGESELTPRTTSTITIGVGSSGSGAAAAAFADVNKISLQIFR
jgi:hypothetical protein